MNSLYDSLVTYIDLFKMLKVKFFILTIGIILGCYTKIVSVGSQCCVDIKLEG